MAETKLLPCPFCGGEPGDNGIVITCTHTHCGGWYVQATREQWNRRVSPSPAPALATDALRSRLLDAAIDNLETLLRRPDVAKTLPSATWGEILIAEARQDINGARASLASYAACIGTIRDMIGATPENISPGHVERYTREVWAALKSASGQAARAEVQVMRTALSGLLSAIGAEQVADGNGEWVSRRCGGRLREAQQSARAALSSPPPRTTEKT